VSTHLFLAPTGHGKTEYVLNRIRHVRAGQPLASVWIILPNQIQARAFGQRLSAAGGALGVQLGTFYRFYGEILARAGTPAARLPDPVLHRLLLQHVDRLAEAGQIPHYASLRGRPGFARLLRGLFQELKQARIQREAFEAAVADAPPRLAELATLYAAYQDWLIRSEWMDAEGQGWLAALALEADPHLAAGLRLLVVDGFDEFNPTQLAVLSLLAGRAAESIVTLTGDLACGDRVAHRRFCRARQAVEEALDLAPTLLPSFSASPKPGPTTAQHPPALAHLESALFQPEAGPLPATEAITCIEAQDRAAEARAAMRWLKSLVLRHDHALHEIALLARDLEPYRPYLAEVAVEFGLPLHVAGGRPLLSNPAIAALLNLLGLPVLDWPRRPLLDALACPYFDWSGQAVTAETARGLEAAARAGLVIAGLDQWREALARLARLQPRAGAAAKDEDLAPPDVPAGDEARGLWTRLQAAIARLTPPPSATVRHYAAFVEDLIGADPKLASRFRHDDDDAPDNSLQIVARAWGASATAERDVAALRRFKDVLRGMVLAESVLLAPGQEPAPLDYARFYAELRGAVEATTYELPEPPPGSAILAAPLLYARGLTFRAVALLGLSEGEFPRPEREDPLLTEADRHALRAAGLSLESRLQGDEVSFFYEAVTRARERLLLSRPYLASDGQAWEASPYWDEVRRLVQVPVRRLHPQEPLPLQEAASLPEALLAAARQAAGADWPAVLQDWDRVQAAARVVRHRESADPSQDPWEGDLADVSPDLAAHYGPHHVWSASRLEAYATCPFLFLTGSVLGLEPRQPPSEGYDVLILGSMYHAILEETYRRALPDAGAGRLRALLPQVAAELFASAPDEYGFRPTALWRRQQEELLGVLVETLEGLIEATAGWQPVELEQAFGIDDKACLDVRSDGRRLRLRGFVDRLDRDESGDLQVIDYKAGSTPISARDLEDGKRLQLPLYALAVREALGLGQVGGGFYWHINSAQASRLRLEAYLGGVDAAIQTALAHALDIVDAVRAGRFPPQPPPRGCPGHCPATGFCWRYQTRGW
jgi:ATP-dependent helicase/DNAse subunit B